MIYIKNKNFLFYLFITLCFIIKHSRTHNLINKRINEEISIPIKYLPEKEKKKLQEEINDTVYISGGQTINDFTNFIDQLDDNEKIIYEAILEVSKKTPPEFEVTVTYDDTNLKLSFDEFREKINNSSMNVITALMNEHPELWWIGPYSRIISYYNDYIHQIHYNLLTKNSKHYGFTNDNIVSLNRKIEIMKNDIKKKISNLGLQTNYAILRYIHDYLIVRNNYLLDENRTHIRNIYGSIVENLCVCEGYAEAFQYLAQQYGINCIIARSNTHEWNMVQMSDSWYHVDVTWDDPGSHNNGYGYDKDISTNYFLIGATNISQREQNNAHVLIFSAFKDHISFDYPPISENDYEPSDNEISELTTMRTKFSNSYLSLTSGNYIFYFIFIFIFILL